jgi:hypothetical protein
MIKSKSIIPHFPTDHSPRTTPHHSGWRGMIKSRSIIPHSPTNHGPRTTDDSPSFRLHGNDKVKVNNSTFPNGPRTIPNGVTGIDMRLKCSLVYRNRTSDMGSVKGGRIGSRNLSLFLLSQSRKNLTGRGI